MDNVPGIDSGDTAWMIVATTLALLYAGMVRVKNALSVLMQCFAIAALVSVLWVIYGYSLAFDTTGKAFNAGSALAANGTAGMAMLVTQVAMAAAALSWMSFEWAAHSKPGALGGAGLAEGVTIGMQVWVQVKCVLFTVACGAARRACL